jgi:hypothetical protein
MKAQGIKDSELPFHRIGEFITPSRLTFQRVVKYVIVVIVLLLFFLAIF